MGRTKHRKGKAAAPAQTVSKETSVIATVSLHASPDFFEASAAIDNGMVKQSDKDGKATWVLESWKKRDKALIWFAKGAAADHTARLTFSPDLSKAMRAELHRLRETRFKTLTSHGVGFGDARCIVFAHSSIDLAAEAGTLTEEQSAIAENLYWDMRAAGKAMSLDEVKTRIVAGELTDTMAAFLQQSSKHQNCLSLILAAIESNDSDKLADTLLTASSAVKSGMPVRGSGTLPLQAAAKLGRVSMMRLLLDTGAPIDAEDGSGMTALQVARKAEECDAEGLLIQHGATDTAIDSWVSPSNHALEADSAANESAAAVSSMASSPSRKAQDDLAASRTDKHASMSPGTADRAVACSQSPAALAPHAPAESSPTPAPVPSTSPPLPAASSRGSAADRAAAMAAARTSSSKQQPPQQQQQTTPRTYAHAVKQAVSKSPSSGSAETASPVAASATHKSDVSHSSDIHHGDAMNGTAAPQSMSTQADEGPFRSAVTQQSLSEVVPNGIHAKDRAASDVHHGAKSGADSMDAAAQKLVGDTTPVRTKNGSASQQQSAPASSEQPCMSSDSHPSVRGSNAAGAAEPGANTEQRGAASRADNGGSGMLGTKGTEVSQTRSPFPEANDATALSAHGSLGDALGAAEGAARAATPETTQSSVSGAVGSNMQSTPVDTPSPNAECDIEASRKLPYAAYGRVSISEIESAPSKPAGNRAAAWAQASSTPVQGPVSSRRSSGSNDAAPADDTEGVTSMLQRLTSAYADQAQAVLKAHPVTASAVCAGVLAIGFFVVSATKRR